MEQTADLIEVFVQDQTLEEALLARAMGARLAASGWKVVSAPNGTLVLVVSLATRERVQSGVVPLPTSSWHSGGGSLGLRQFTYSGTSTGTALVPFVSTETIVRLSVALYDVSRLESRSPPVWEATLTARWNYFERNREGLVEAVVGHVGTTYDGSVDRNRRPKPRHLQNGWDGSGFGEPESGSDLDAEDPSRK